MKPFHCQNCGNLLFFENVSCEQCAHRLGYLPEQSVLSALEPEGDDWRALASGSGSYRFCANAEFDACNWLIPTSADETFCLACRHNGVVPNLRSPQNVLDWRKLEAAKHHLFYSLLRLELPIETRAQSRDNGLIFEFLADAPGADKKVMTGHDEGLITIALAEADDVEREKRRNAMGEPYRTLLGHFRHEVGHYYWDRLVRDRGLIDPCRAVFGDESRDYGEALRRYYAEGAPDDWQENYVSRYATTHPWEDFAETWAHYLHIVDTLEMASAFTLEYRVLQGGNEARKRVEFDPYVSQSFSPLIQAWLPLTLALNSVNRCMGAGDLYPFVLSPAVVAKLGFIHELVHGKVTAA